ncbi:uncharacterized protein G2W53_039067 [Senna tora]|uniref:Uncharacterized protein n=1 Tax=Senna tora TaxID=362788 RepID=A0A834SPD9_9FABA|nr:uncharacterized protein G2W53_039067 [Senna tora]
MAIFLYDWLLHAGAVFVTHVRTDKRRRKSR